MSDKEHQPGFFETIRREMRIRNYSHKTIKAYLSCLRLFVHYFHPKHPREISEKEIRCFLLYLLEERKFEASSVNQVFNALRLLYVDLYGMSFKIGSIPRPRKEKKLPDILSQNEVLRIFRVVGNMKHKVMLMLAYAGGLRVGELVSLKVEDIDPARMMIHIRCGKGKKDRYTILSKNVLTVLKAYSVKYGIGETGWLFRGENPTYHLSARSIQNVFRNAAEKAGINKPVSMHSLRHSFATDLLEHGTDLRYIQELLGHASTKTTEIYTHVCERTIGKIKSPLDSLVEELTEMSDDRPLLKEKD